MKVDITCIIRDQFRTMGGSFFGWIADCFFFFVLPLILAVLTVRAEVVFKIEVYGYALTVFSIFAALLITAQITIFGLFQKHSDRISDDSKADAAKKSIQDGRAIKRNERRRDNLRELNSNISYLTLLSCLCATIVLIFLAFGIAESVETFIATFIYTHFACSLAMVLKRFHIVFEDEYTSYD